MTREGSRIKSPEGVTAPPGDYASWDDYMQTVEDDAARESAWMRDEAARRGLKAMRLAPSLAVCRALLAGQKVPDDALDPHWRRRYFAA